MTHDSPRSLPTLYAAHLRTLMRRFDEALAACGLAGVLVYSGSPPLVFRDDQHYPFKAHAWFKAWLPLIDAPDCLLCYEPGRKLRLLFLQPRDYWHLPPATPREFWTDAFDVQPIAELAAARPLLPADLTHFAFIGAPTAEISAWSPGAVNPQALLARLEFERAIKTDYELERLREASRLAARGHRAAARAFKAGGSEFEIELAFLSACGQREQELPYNPIVALNEGGAVLHYQVLERKAPSTSRSLLIDAGCEVAGYASDVTRTHSRKDRDFAALITAFDDVQQNLCAGVHAGVDWRDVHLTAHRLVAEFLNEADVTHCDAEEAVDSGLSGVFMPHGIGHLLGLQVHDVGGWQASAEGGEIPRPEGHPYLRLTRVLQPGFVVTMEPGIYFIDQLLDEARADKRRGKMINWSRVQQLKPFGGIRIEDDLAVTAKGCENLTRDAFQVLEMRKNAIGGPDAAHSARRSSGRPKGTKRRGKPGSRRGTRG
ncbi:MAG TPA: Xaa-Pro dipeptidase [Steroidobacteraceae bacterium]|nr:Xaa-Pro dipeptidase [Steroidobacteraceae bacterium]